MFLICHNNVGRLILKLISLPAVGSLLRNISKIIISVSRYCLRAMYIVVSLHFDKPATTCSRARRNKQKKKWLKYFNQFFTIENFHDLMRHLPIPEGRCILQRRSCRNDLDSGDFDLKQGVFCFIIGYTGCFGPRLDRVVLQMSPTPLSFFHRQFYYFQTEQSSYIRLLYNTNTNCYSFAVSKHLYKLACFC